MGDIEKIMEFAEQIAKEDELKMKRLEAWEKYIKPLFKKKFGYNYNPAYVSMYRKEWQEWIESKRQKFNENYSQ